MSKSRVAVKSAWLKRPGRGWLELTTFAVFSRCSRWRLRSSPQSPSLVGSRSRPHGGARRRLRFVGFRSQCAARRCLHRHRHWRWWHSAPESSSRSCSMPPARLSAARWSRSLEAAVSLGVLAATPVLVALVQDPMEVAVGIWVVAIVFIWVVGRAASPRPTRGPAREHPARARRQAARTAADRATSTTSSGTGWLGSCCRRDPARAAPRSCVRRGGAEIG